jgi:formylglycine-generating enzyme required for sulfatase activity
MNKISREHLKRFIAVNKLDDSIEKLIQLLGNYLSQKEDKSVLDMYDSLFVHLRNLKNISAKDSKGTIDPKESRLENNKIADSLIELVNRIPVSVFEQAELERKAVEAEREKERAKASTQNEPSNRTWMYLIGGVGALLVLVIVGRAVKKYIDSTDTPLVIHNPIDTPHTNASAQATPNTEKDKDGDGVVDSKDNCPTEAGDIGNYGCPKKATPAPATTKPTPSSNDPFAGQMVYISGGTFQMGSEDGADDEKPPHSVTVSSFHMSKYEVTQAQWRAVMGNDPSELNNKGCDQCPVERVSWEDVQKFITKLNTQTRKDYRLPTEAEWEYAARGGQPYTYAGSDDIGSVAWYDGNYKSSKHGSQGTTHPVGRLKANGYGLYDMSGNVREWCSDWYKGYPGSSGVSNLTGSDRVIRGGCWYFNPQDCRVARRKHGTPADWGFNIGFRLVVSQ